MFENFSDYGPTDRKSGHTISLILLIDRIWTQNIKNAQGLGPTPRSARPATIDFVACALLFKEEQGNKNPIDDEKINPKYQSPYSLVYSIPTLTAVANFLLHHSFYLLKVTSIAT